MGFQRSSNVLAAIKRETTAGTAATSGSATQMRITDSPGLEAKRVNIQSKEKRVDGLIPLGRLGGRTVDGSYNGELTVGGATDILFEALQRGTWTAAVPITQATMTSITTTTNTIVAAAGSWLTQGVRVGDIVTITGQDAGNEGLRVRVTDVVALTITVAGTPLTINATPDTTFAVTILKKVVNPAALIHYTHTVEQYNIDHDLTELFLGCMCVGIKLSCKPNAMIEVVYTFIGMDRTILVTGTSPWFTSPSLTTGLSLIADDSAILKDGVVVTTFTGFDLDFQITAKGEPVIGSFVTPVIWDNDLMVSGTITGIQTDFANLTAFEAETEFSLSLLAQEPGAAPRAAFGVFLPRVKFGGISVPFGGGDGGKIETRTLMTGPFVATSKQDGGVCIFQSSAP